MKANDDSPTARLDLAEKAFIQALLWEEANLEIGPAYQLLRDHGLDVHRLFDAVLRLDPEIQDRMLPLLSGPCPWVTWPWTGMNGCDILLQLHSRCRPD